MAQLLRTASGLLGEYFGLISLEPLRPHGPAPLKGSLLWRQKDSLDLGANTTQAIVHSLYCLDA
jgi:hypothetical protein